MKLFNSLYFDELIDFQDKNLCDLIEFPWEMEADIGGVQLFQI